MENKYPDPLKIYCHNCGAPVGFNILKQTYCCPHCGQEDGITQVQQASLEWKQLNKKQTKIPQEGIHEYNCPSCGSRILFTDGNVSRTCDFCHTNLVRTELLDGAHFPDLIIPFFLTEDEAKERFSKWANQHRTTQEGRQVLKHLNQMKGYYLPYQFVRGPIYGKAHRQNTERNYPVKGFLEGVVVNTNKQLDNEVLNAMEPYDWSAVRPFEIGYIAGHKVKLDDLPSKAIKSRVLLEAESNFLPQVQKVLQTKGVSVDANSDSLITMSTLLPVYFIHVGQFLATMNGQTGRISVSNAKETKNYFYLIEPFIYTLLFTIISSIPYRFALEPLLLFVAVYACIFFFVMGDGKRAIITQRILKSRATSLQRNSDQLLIDANNQVVKNPFDNTPIFYEEYNGQEVPVKIRFYTLGRLLVILRKILITFFLPAIFAAIIRFFQVYGTSESFFEHFDLLGGAAWYMIAGFLCLLYWIKAIRNDIYEYPILYQIKENGKLKRISKSSSRATSIFSMFGVGEIGSDGKPFTLLQFLFSLGGIGLFLVGTFLFIFIGSVAAILS